MSEDDSLPWYVLTAADQLARRGLEVRRHSSWRRQAMLTKHDVDVVLDVGAADGGYGRSLRKFGYDGRIVSFEPLSASFESLQATIRDDPKWTAHHLALGAESGSATINIASNRASSSFRDMLDSHRAAAPAVDYVGQETVTVSRLDDVDDGHVASARHPFLKIDTQGFEREVLAGATHLVGRCVGLQLELSFIPLYDGGMLVDEAVAWAYEQGFHLVNIEQGYSAPSGEILQVDGVFFRSTTEGLK
jgi:FkbM family methyltransferase